MLHFSSRKEKESRNPFFATLMRHDVLLLPRLFLRPPPIALLRPTASLSNSDSCACYSFPKSQLTASAQLNTLAITLYYPSSLSSLPARPWARPWLPQPISLIGTGYARILRIYSPPLQSLVTFFLWAFGSKTVIPGVDDAPLLRSRNETFAAGDFAKGRVITEVGIDGKAKDVKSLDEVLELRDERGKVAEKDGNLPCVVFTHGMAGMSQSYSNYLGSIASHGYVVAAVEHRDGSGPGTIVHHPNGTDQYVWHVQLQDLE